ncbi:hypothetical protein QBC44DRAFT_372847 [Cladorrhinum sp. PSN332]|nr:hypothetical protein QBC44DRAFT_372847 [Cladorrhinum sp. PSN332]
MATGVDAKLLKSTKFPPEFNQKVDMTKVNLQVMKKWIAGRITEILGNEDDVVIELAFNLIEGTRHPDIKAFQIQLTGFLDKDTPAFCKEMWKLLLSGQASPQGVPKELLEAKKQELMQEKIEAEKAAEQARQRREELERRNNDRGRGGGRGGRGGDSWRGGRDDRDRGFGRGGGRSRSPPRFRDREEALLFVVAQERGVMTDVAVLPHDLYPRFPPALVHALDLGVRFPDALCLGREAPLAAAVDLVLRPRNVTHLSAVGQDHLLAIPLVAVVPAQFRQVVTPPHPSAVATAAEALPVAAQGLAAVVTVARVHIPRDHLAPIVGAAAEPEAEAIPDGLDATAGLIHSTVDGHGTEAAPVVRVEALVLLARTVAGAVRHPLAADLDHGLGLGAPSVEIETTPGIDTAREAEDGEPLVDHRTLLSEPDPLIQALKTEPNPAKMGTAPRNWSQSSSSQSLKTANQERERELKEKIKKMRSSRSGDDHSEANSA